jgi:hypothetical protein
VLRTTVAELGTLLSIYVCRKFLDHFVFTTSIVTNFTLREGCSKAEYSDTTRRGDNSSERRDNSLVILFIEFLIVRM